MRYEKGQVFIVTQRHVVFAEDKYDSSDFRHDIEILNKDDLILFKEDYENLLKFENDDYYAIYYTHDPISLGWVKAVEGPKYRAIVKHRYGGEGDYWGIVKEGAILTMHPKDSSEYPFNFICGGSWVGYKEDPVKSGFLEIVRD